MAMSGITSCQISGNCGGPFPEEEQSHEAQTEKRERAGFGHFRAAADRGKGKEVHDIRPALSIGSDVKPAAKTTAAS